MNEVPLKEKKIYSKLWLTNKKEERNESNR